MRCDARYRAASCMNQPLRNQEIQVELVCEWNRVSYILGLTFFKDTMNSKLMSYPLAISVTRK